MTTTKMKNDRYTPFSQRLALSKLYYQWGSKNDAALSPLNVITYLDGHGLLDRDAVKSFLKKEATNAK